MSTRSAHGVAGRQDYDALVVGAGMAGLAAADELARAGSRVAVVEAAPVVGGLARSVEIAGEPIEPYYHHVFPQDAATLSLLRRLGLEGRLEWHKAPMGMLHGGRVRPFNSALDIAKFDALDPVARVRLAFGTAVQLVRADTRTLDRRSTGQEGPRWFGRVGYEVLWRPLLEAKFGPYADDVAMAWLRARLRQRAGGRGVAGDRLGYIRGGSGALATAYAAGLSNVGVNVLLSSAASALERREEGWRLSVASPNGRELEAPIVVAAVSGGVLARIVQLPGPYAQAMEAIPYRGIVCALVVLDRPLSSYYWTNVTDRLGMGCVGIIEHTNFVDRARYGGRSLVYLAHYVDPTDPAWEATGADLLEAAADGFRALNPAFSRDWVQDVHVARDLYAQPVPIAGGPMARLPIATGLPGLWHASLAHVYPDDRGVSKALDIGRRAAAAALADRPASGHP